LVVGAGALGNICGLGLALSGFRNVTFLDPDIVEATNLNRQVLFFDAVGKSKAETLAERLTSIFGGDFRGRVEYLRRETDISGHDILLDCVDNFETRIVLSEKAKSEGKVFISGGTGADSGQVVAYDPEESAQTPAELLGLYDIVEQRDVEAHRRERESCIYRPDPSVIMPNLVIAGLMVDLLRGMLRGASPKNLFYDSKHHARFL
jgi:molybdopterin/thiamine biosynthesis adenylyltransferase